MSDAGYPVTPNQLGGWTGYSSLTKSENTQLWKEAGEKANEALTFLLSQTDYISDPDDFKVLDVQRLLTLARGEAKADAVIRKLEPIQDDAGAMAKKLAEMQDDGLVSRTDIINFIQAGITTDQDFIELEKQGLITEVRLNSLGITKP